MRGREREWQSPRAELTGDDDWLQGNGTLSAIGDSSALPHLLFGHSGSTSCTSFESFQSQFCIQIGSPCSRPPAGCFHGCVRDDKECVTHWWQPLWTLIAPLSCWGQQKLSFSSGGDKDEIDRLPLKVTASSAQLMHLPAVVMSIVRGDAHV